MVLVNLHDVENPDSQAAVEAPKSLEIKVKRKL